jgi:hypothetical protein
VFIARRLRFAYRFHLTDPVRFQQDLRATIQALAGALMGVTCPCRTISPVAYCTRLYLAHRSRLCPIAMS